MSYPAMALISIVIFAFVHLWATKTNKLDKIMHGRLLSFGGGVSIAYVFIDLLPKLSKKDILIHDAFTGISFLEKHAYIFALAGFLLFFSIDRAHTFLKKNESFWISLCSYALFNFLVGYAVVDKNDPEVQPLALFTFAMALHYFVNDFSINKEHFVEYNRYGKWVLIVSLFLGWLVGVWITLPQAAVALVSAFIGGGVIMNVTRHELPKDNPHSLGTFIFSAVAYTCVLLTIGS